MAESPPPRPASTTITALSDDLLLEIFLHFPDVTTLARAAFTCRAFLRAVRSSPAFRRLFRERHSPPLLALFLMPHMRAIVPGKSSDIAAAFSSLLRDSDASESQWRSKPEISYREGYACFVNRVTGQGASYNPHSQALKICPKMATIRALLEFHTLPEDGEEKRPSRVVCVHRDRAWAWARVAVFSSRTMEWQVVLPEMKTGGLRVDCDKYATGTVVNGFVCWIHKAQGCILALNTATFQFSRMELPLLLKFSMFQLGQTNDGKLCIVSFVQCVLCVWLWDKGVGIFMMHKMFPLRANFLQITELSEGVGFDMQPMAVINGFVYLSAYLMHPKPKSHQWCCRDPRSPEWFLSCCLETAEMNLLYKKSWFLLSIVDLYIMVSWPSSLINGKEDSDIGVVKMSEDGGPMGTEKASLVLFTALQSFKQKIIDDNNSNFAEIESFLLDDEMNSLLNRIATFESGLAAARDRVLRIGTEPNSIRRMEIGTSQN